MFRWSRHWLGMFMIVGVPGAWLCCTMLIAPTTTFAAAASPHGSSSCGTSNVTQSPVTDGQAGASIRLNHTLGQVGTPVVISGVGWPDDTTIMIDAYGYHDYDGTEQLELGQPALVRARTNSTGTFQTAPFAAPDYLTCGIGADYGEPGSVVYFRAHTHNNQVSAQARFRYQLTPELTTTTEAEMGILPGITIPITGDGWEAGEWVTVTTSVTHGLSQEELNNGSTAQPSGEVPIRVKAIGFGEFTIRVIVPRDLTPHTALVVSATATGPIYGHITAPAVVFNIQPTVAPILKANLAEGYPGAVVTLSGTNWLSPGVLAEYCRGQTDGYSLGYIWPNVISHLDCYPPNSEGLGAAPVRGGTFHIKVTIPDNARPGPITIQVRTASDILPGIFVLAVPFMVLTPWQIIHPRLAEALHVGKVAGPFVLLVGVGAGAFALWRRRRRSLQVRQGG